MIRTTNLLLTVAVALALAASAGATDLFNLADLADGETRVFEKGGKSLTATRTGDHVNLVMLAPGKPARDEACDLTSEVCRVGLEEVSSEVRIIVMKTIERDASESAGATVQMLAPPPGDGTRTMVIVSKGDGAGPDHERTPGSVPSGQAVFISDAGTPLTLERTGEWTAAEGDTFESVDLAELADGESRAFGPADNELTATRTGATVWLTRADRPTGDPGMQCNLTTDNCKVTVVKHGAEGPTRVMVERRSKDGHEVEEDVRMHGQPGVDDGDVIIERTEDKAGNVRIEKRIRRNAPPK